MTSRLILSSMVVILIAMFSTGCSEQNVSSGNDGKIQAVSTIGMISDIVANVGGDHVDSEGIMGPGVDPHLYKASQGDISKLDKADIIFYNGLNLEGKMTDMFVKMASQKPTIQVTEYIEENKLHKPEAFDGHYDPHLWFDVQLWMKAVERVRDGLIELDPDHETDYMQNAENYLAQLTELNTYAREQLASIPREFRVLVTAHDAFGYMGSAYDMEVMALQGISTDAEYGIKDVQNLVNVLVDRNIKAVFVESSVSPKAIEAVVEGAKEKGHDLKIGGELLSDAMGEEGTEEGTYIGMVRHNIDTIVSALK